MAGPQRSEAHVNRPLGNISVAYQQEEADFVCDKLFPLLAVQKQSDRYFVYDRSYWFKTGAQKRAPSTESAGGSFGIDNTPSYFCDKWAFHQDVSDDIIVNCDDPINAQADATRFVTRNILLRREKLFAARYMSPGVWGGFGATNANGVYTTADFVPTRPWSDDRSNPMADVSMLQSSIKEKTGFKPNKIVVSHDVNERLKQHPLVIDRIKYTQTGIANEALMAALFDVDEYLVASAIENSAQEGQVGNYSFINKNKFLLVYAAKNPGLQVPTGGYIFTWAGMYGSSALGSRIKTFRLEHLECERIEGEMAFDMHMIGADLGVFCPAAL